MGAEQTITAFAHTKGGVGKSTMAWHTALMLQERGESVTVVDLDFQKTVFFLSSIRDKRCMNPLDVRGISSVELLMETMRKIESDHIIIDIGGFDNDTNRAAIKMAGRVVVPISNSVTEVLGFKTFESILEKMGEVQIHVLLSNIHPLAKNFDEIKQAIGGKENVTLLDAVVRSRKVYRETMGVGKSVFDTSNLTAQKEIEEVWHGLRCDQ
jgi:chromosome partitioning protein